MKSCGQRLLSQSLAVLFCAIGVIVIGIPERKVLAQAEIPPHLRQGAKKLSDEEKRYAIATLSLMQCLLVAPRFTEADHSNMEKLPGDVPGEARYVDRQVGMIIHVTSQQCFVAVVGRDLDKVASGVEDVLRSRDRGLRALKKGADILWELRIAGTPFFAAVRPFQTPFGPSIAMAIRVK